MEIHGLLNPRNATRIAVWILALCAVRVTQLQAAVSDGYVVKVDSPVVYLDWGKPSGVHPGDRFKVYRAGAELNHPVTGEVLGRTDQAVAEGLIESVADKFSVGKLYQTERVPEVGDRTHYDETLSSVPDVVLSTPSVISSSESVAGLTELWRSPPLPVEVVGLAIGDLAGEGHSEVAVASKDEIDVYRISAHLWTLIAQYKGRLYRHWLNLESADLKHQGRDELFATVWQDGYRRPRVVVFELEDSHLQPHSDFEGFVRVVARPGAHTVMAWQNISRSKEKSLSAPVALIVDGGHYKPGPSLRLRPLREDQLFGFAVGGWDKNPTAETALIEAGDSLHVYRTSGSWTAPEAYGGTRNDFELEGDTRLLMLPRLLLWSTAMGDELITARNIADSAVRMKLLNPYKSSEIVGLTGNGTELTARWRQPLPGYLAEIALGDGLNAGSPQLWAAEVTSDGKTTLIAYRLP